MTDEIEISCPFCGENSTIVVDCSIENQTYIEDCYVCCKPISFQIQCSEGEFISAYPERSF